MERISFRLEEPHDADLRALVDAGVYPNKSEAIRAAVRQLVDMPRHASKAGDGFPTCDVNWCGGRAVATLEAETGREDDDGKRCRGCLAYDLDL